LDTHKSVGGIDILHIGFSCKVFLLAGFRISVLKLSRPRGRNTHEEVGNDYLSGLMVNEEVGNDYLSGLMVKEVGNNYLSGLIVNLY
jgi:hypothetical protein